MPYIGNSPGTGTRNRYIYTATASQTTFSGADDNGKTLAYSDGDYVDVFLNGICLVPVDDYTATSKTSIVLTVGAAVDDILEVVAYDIATIADTVSKANGGNFEAGINVDGNVGIGTTSPSSANSLNTVLSVNASTSEKAGISLSENDTNRFDVFFDGSDNSAHLYNSASGGMRFYGTGTERMRISASGNIGVGTNDPDDHTSAGVRLFNDGRSYSTVDGNFCFTANRLSSDGTLIRLQKDSTTVGSIGIQSSGFQIDGEPSHTGILFVANAWQPKYNGSTSDNFVDLGASSVRFDDIYATNGTIQTSDQNEKQQIASLTDAEITAAKAISKLFKTFKWNDAVTEKGDAARTHSGVIAQDVEQAMTDAGLNAGNYAFFISTTWWEADGETYDTAEEAPESATERNRKGIRYPQLLSFIGAATEQRLASIESRLDALETA